MKTTVEIENDIILGKDYSNLKRGIAFFSIALIYFFYCYNFMVGTFIKPTMIYALADGGFGFSLKQTEEIFAVMSFGTIPGTFIFGVISAKIGKKRTLISVALLIGLTTFIPMLSPTNIMLWKIARLCTGVVLGGVFGTAMPLVADMFPSKYRGKLAAILTALFSLAMIFGGKVYGVLGDANWQILMYTAIIPPIVGAILAIFFVPDDLEYTKELVKKGKETGEKISYISMYKGKYLWIGLGTILLSGANFTAYSAFSNNATTYLVTGIGMSAAVAGSIYSLQGIGQLVGYLFWGSIADKFGRKIPFIGMALAAVFVFIYTKLGGDNTTTFYMISVLLGVAVGYSGAWGAYYTELFPSKYRSLSSGMSFNGGRIISTFAIPAIAGTASGTLGMMTIFYISIAVFVAGAIVWLFLPETLNNKK
ncbi:TPA: MFS transporter [Clostridioides difficile]|nr:MFS transporter [Clostridioides difficile]HBE9786363.1 MFS transporter [Clostridioides difficile]HBG3682739.1 MFS transporter [Clostridioides difficile]HBG3898170.1 MFS transporter [Clostridioides difficile]HBG4347267.1 MFS transporter [Clostridioides difficile]